MSVNKPVSEAENTPDTAEMGGGVSVRDKSGRRSFIRNGAALLLAGTATTAFADCDGNPEQQRRCSDNDEGANSDTPGCGRCGRAKTVPSGLPHTREMDFTIERIQSED